MSGFFIPAVLMGTVAAARSRRKAEKAGTVATKGLGAARRVASPESKMQWPGVGGGAVQSTRRRGEVAWRRRRKSSVTLRHALGSPRRLDPVLAEIPMAGIRWSRERNAGSAG
nr:unnamed protein product [Digitaria exilis]